MMPIKNKAAAIPAIVDVINGRPTNCWFEITLRKVLGAASDTEVLSMLDVVRLTDAEGLNHSIRVINGLTRGTAHKPIRADVRKLRARSRWSLQRCAQNGSLLFKKTLTCGPACHNCDDTAELRICPQNISRKKVLA